MRKCIAVLVTGFVFAIPTTALANGGEGDGGNKTKPGNEQPGHDDHPIRPCDSDNSGPYRSEDCPKPPVVCPPGTVLDQRAHSAKVRAVKAHAHRAVHRHRHGNHHGGRGHGHGNGHEKDHGDKDKPVCVPTPTPPVVTPPVVTPPVVTPPAAVLVGAPVSTPVSRPVSVQERRATRRRAAKRKRVIAKARARAERRPAFAG